MKEYKLSLTLRVRTKKDLDYALEKIKPVMKKLKKMFLAKQVEVSELKYLGATKVTTFRRMKYGSIRVKAASLKEVMDDYEITDKSDIKIIKKSYIDKQEGVK